MKHFLLAALIGSSFSALSGCGSPIAEKPASIASSEKQVSDMVKARAIFEGSDKNWANLPKDKQSEFTQLVGGKPEDATRWWTQMGTPLGGGARSSNGPR